jgi:hypothetical protein
MHRIIPSLALAFGVTAVGCGGGGRASEAPPPATAEMEATQGTAGAADTRRAERTPQEQRTPETGAPTQGQGANVSDAEVTAFADVYRQLVTLQEQGAARVQSGEDAEIVAMELQPRVEQIFEGTTMTPERFDEIGQLASTDDVLRQRIEAELARSPS